MRLVGFLAVVVASASPALAQEAGWNYSPLPGEGDRAAMGCTYGSTPAAHSCLVVRCEDDSTIGVHIHTSRPEGDVGQWALEFDKGDPRLTVDATADGSPYGAKVEGEVTTILDALKNGAMVYLEPEKGEALDRAISLNGSLYVINQALYFCAPKAIDEPASQPDQATR